MHHVSRLLTIGLALTSLLACGGPEGPPGPKGDDGAAGLAGIDGDDGDDGDAGLDGIDGDDGVDGTNGVNGVDGDDGPEGPQGPAGPLGVPPHLTLLDPAIGSASSEVRISGTGFSTTLADNLVTFGGSAATVIAANATELRVRPELASLDATAIAVSVEVARQSSNPLVFSLVREGTPRALAIAMPSTPTGVVAIGTDVFVAAGGRNAGLYRLDDDGSVRLVVAAEVLGGSIVDSPVALATDDVGVLFVTALGAVRRFDPLTGVVTELLAPTLGGGSFPARSGIARTIDGALYVVDRSQSAVLRFADGVVDVIEDPTFVDAFGIATDGVDLFVTDEVRGSVVRIADPGAAATVTTGFITGALEPRGIAVVDGDVVVSNSDGTLAAAALTGAAVAPFGFAAGYHYPADALALDDDGDLLLAQPVGGVVRRIAAGGDDADIVVAGVLPAFGSARVGSTLFIAGVGPGLFGGPPPGGQPDGAVIAIDDDGTSRVLATVSLPLGLVADADGLLTVSDCLEQRIFTLDPAAGTQTDLLTDAEGLTCPAGLAVDDAGGLFYLDTQLGGGGDARVGRLEGDVDDPVFADGFAPGSIFLVRAGDRLLATAIGPSTPAGFDVEFASALTGGNAQRLVAGPTFGGGPLVVSPAGRVFTLRGGIGAILEVDPITGDLLPFGSALIGAVGGPGGGPGSAAFTASFEPDGTLLVPDFAQGAIIAVTP